MDAKTFIRNLTAGMGIALVAATGLFFILFVDLYLSGNSVELFIGIFPALASVVCFILAESFKHKPVVFYILKFAAFAFACAFVFYCFYFKTTDTYTGTRTFLKLIKTYPETKETVFFLDNSKFNDCMDIEFDKAPAYLVMIICAIVGAASQFINGIMNMIVGLD